MPVIDFREIAAGNAANGEQDQFEFFAREFLVFLGYRVVSGPDRGPDGGRDLIVEELRTGLSGDTRIPWLVSCKHFAPSGKAVGLPDETDIGDRVRSKKCAGFMAFYSVPISSGLASKLEGLGAEGILIQRFDPHAIERELLRSRRGLELAERYFPKSIAGFLRENPKPADILIDVETLACENCGKDLLTKDLIGRSIVVVISTYNNGRARDFKERIEALYCCCKGECDRILKNRYLRSGLVDGWEDLKDLAIPTVYIRWMMASLNKLRAGVTYDQTAFDKEKKMLIALFSRVARSLTSEERERIKTLISLPTFAGGFAPP